MKSARSRLAAALAGIFAVAGVAAAQSRTIVVLNKVATEDAGGRLVVPDLGCVLANNIWNPSQNPAGFSQNVFVEKQGNGMLPGWSWSAPGPRQSVLSMPELVCGDKPWDEPQRLRAEFPFHPGDKRLAATFDVSLHADGRHNMAFSLWAVSKLPAVKQNISLEIMIWNVDSGMPRAGAKTGTLVAGGRTFDVYVKGNQGVITGPDPFTWKLVMFVAREPFLGGTIVFDPFLQYLIDKRLLSHDDYLTSLELGTEVADGAGRVLVRKFDLRAR